MHNTQNAKQNKNHNWTLWWYHNDINFNLLFILLYIKGVNVQIQKHKESKDQKQHCMWEGGHLGISSTDLDIGSNYIKSDFHL